MIKFKKAYNWKIMLIAMSVILLFIDALYASNTLRLPLGQSGSRIEDSYFKETQKDLNSYLENENYFYRVLPPEMKKKVLERVKALENARIRTSDGTERSITDYVKYLLSEYGYEDRLEHIIVTGSYLFSPTPADVDFHVGLRGDAKETPDFSKTIRKIIHSVFVEKKHPSIIVFPEGSEFSVKNSGFMFAGEGAAMFRGEALNRQEYLAYLYYYSGVMLYGNPISKKDIKELAFITQARSTIARLIWGMQGPGIRDGIGTRRILYRLLQIVLIVSDIDSQYLEILNPKEIYSFIYKYCSEDINQSKKASQALDELDNYLTPEKAKSIYVYFLLNEIKSLVQKEDKEALKKVKELSKLGNKQASQYLQRDFSLFKISEVTKDNKLFWLKINKDVRYPIGKEFYEIPEIALLFDAIENIEAKIAMQRNIFSRISNILTNFQRLSQEITTRIGL